MHLFPSSILGIYSDTTGRFKLILETQLIAQKGYTDEKLPTAETIATKLNLLGYYPKKVAKSQPQKNSPRQMPSSPK